MARAVVAGPTLDLRIELIDYSFLRSLEISAEHRCHIGGVSFLSILTRRDDGFESEWFAVRRASRVVFTNAVLANVEPQEVEPRLTLPSARSRCARSASCSGFSSSPIAGQPLARRSCRALLDHVAVFVQHHEVVGVPDHDRLPGPVAVPRE